MDYKKNLSNFILSLGLDTFGFMKLRDFPELYEELLNRKIHGSINELEEKDIDKRIKASMLYKEGKTIISIAFPYLYEESLYENNGTYFSVYTRGYDYHRVISKYLNEICEYIKKLSFNAVAFTDSNPLPERYIAKLCSIGEVGKNGCLYTKKYGSYVFLSEIITDMEIDIEEKSPKYKEENNLCSSCNICLLKCPTGALKCKNFNICLSYITQKKAMEDCYLTKLGGRLFGCDTCQNVCPLNKGISFSNIPEFKPLSFMNNTDKEIIDIIKMDNSYFKDRFKLTSCGFRGKNVIKRNAAINYVNMHQNEITKEKLSNLINNSIYVEEHISRLLKLLHL